MMNRFGKLLAVLLVLMLVLSSCSMITVDQDKLSAKTAAVVGSEVITRGEAEPVYENMVDYYTYMYYYNYGVTDMSPFLDGLKQQALDSMVEERLVKQKAAELGLDQLSEEDLAAVYEESDAEYEEYVTNYSDSVNTEGMDEEQARAAVVAYLAENGLTLESLRESHVSSHIAQLLYDKTVEGVTVSDEDLKALFDEKVSADETSYTDSTYMYEYYKTYGQTIYWNPEGYRYVKHILLLLSDEQQAELTALQDELTDIEAQISALETPVEEEAAGEEGTEGETGSTTGESGEAAATEEQTEETEETAEETEETEEAVEEEAAPAFTLEELTQMKADKEKEIEEKQAELFASFEEKIAEITARFEAGEAFDDLMAEYGEDPGMQREPAMTEGYVVSADSVMWEQTFTDHAMAIENPGEISEAFLGSRGVHIVYYVGDVTPGAVDFETVKDTLGEEMLKTKQDEAYDAAYEAWKADAKVKTYPEVLGEQ